MLLCYMDTDSFVVCIKTKDIYIDIVKNVEVRFDLQNYEGRLLGRTLPKIKNEKVIGIIKFSFMKTMITEFATCR